MATASAPKYFAGPHTATFNSISMGRLSGGVEIKDTYQSAPVISDQYGLIDQLYTGMVSVLTLHGLDLNTLAGLNPGDNSNPAFLWGSQVFGTMPTVGKFASQDSVGKVLSIVPVNVPGFNVVANCAVLISDIGVLLNTRQPSIVPVTFLLLPYLDSQVYKTYVATQKNS